MFYENSNIASCPFQSCSITSMSSCTLSTVLISNNCATNILTATPSGTVTFPTVILG